MSQITAENTSHYGNLYMRTYLKRTEGIYWQCFRIVKFKFGDHSYGALEWIIVCKMWHIFCFNFWASLFHEILCLIRCRCLVKNNIESPLTRANAEQFQQMNVDVGRVALTEMEAEAASYPKHTLPLHRKKTMKGWQALFEKILTAPVVEPHLWAGRMPVI